MRNRSQNRQTFPPLTRTTDIPLLDGYTCAKLIPMTNNPNETPTPPNVASFSERRLAGILLFIAMNTLIPCLLGSLFVVSILPLNALVLLIWLALLVFGSRHHFNAHRTTCGMAIIGIQVFVMVSIITAAHFAPVKTTDSVLARTVMLPETEMTLAELRERAAVHRRESFPIVMYMTVPNNEESAVIRFPAPQMTLRQFVAAIENQSSLRHRFSHCGNGWTVLWGGDCRFGMHMLDPYRPFH